MNNNNILILLAITFILGSCKKEEVTNEYITINEYGSEVYEFTPPTSNIDIEGMGNSWSLDDRLGYIEIGRLDSGDVLVAQTQLRLRDISPMCNSNISVQNGAVMTHSLSDVPSDESARSIGQSVNFGEGWRWDENYVYFYRIGALTVDTLIENAIIGQWVNIWQASCQEFASVQVQVAQTVVTVYRK